VHYSIERTGRRERRGGKEERICKTEEREVVGKKIQPRSRIALTFGYRRMMLGGRCVNSRVIRVCRIEQAGERDRRKWKYRELRTHVQTKRRQKEKHVETTTTHRFVTLKICDRIKNRAQEKYKDVWICGSGFARAYAIGPPFPDPNQRWGRGSAGE